MTDIKHYHLHLDMDAFFASVEQLDHPEYRGKPLIVGGKPEDRRSVVSTASYEARKYGVHSAMPTYKAYELCPNGIFVYGNMKRYSEVSYHVMSILHDYSPDVEQMSIDEAFIDLTGTEKLFGPPIETAKKIKERVKRETGLTISVGIAPTKYLAKIASDMNKPDGLYVINEGEEQNFMLNLPLKKVWGVGDKTYNALINSGLKTTRDIYERSLEALTFMYGNNTGNFLYNVVRGIECITFDKKTKSHSISSETTFPFDVTDIYTVETSIMELAHSIFFRLLKENGFSRTVMVKIRYEDFTTVSIQQTYPTSILTIDTLFNCAKELFERKFENGRGVRLIGIALCNIENEERPYQQSLFDDDNEKKQKVEKAILNLEKKHPEIKIRKARTFEKSGKILKSLVAVFSTLLLSIFASNNLNAQEGLDYDIHGYWKSDVTGAIKSTFGSDTSFALSSNLPVIKNEVDLSALINITQKLYFSLEFLDGFNHNTYTFGYNGDKYLNKFLFSNRGITFPEIYSSSLTNYGIGGGTNQAPGLSFHYTDYKNNKWESDLLLRYDLVKQNSMTFVGNNRINDSIIKPENFLYSDTFVLPSSDNISSIKNIYIQDDNGNYKDSKNQTFQKLDADQFILLPEKKLIILSQEIKYSLNSTPIIAVSFFQEDDLQKTISETGSYSNSQTFAGKIQDYFNKNGKYDLSEYSQITTATINNENCLIIQNGKHFSPYSVLNKYLVSKNIEDGFIREKNTHKALSEYHFTEDESLFNFTASSYFTNKKMYGIITSDSAKIDSYDNPEVRYPFGQDYPEIYLNIKKDLPVEIINRTFEPVKEFDIGKNVEKGSVRVYLNGTLDAGAIYDSDSGFVRLSSQISELDEINITYFEEGSNFESGIITAGYGFLYRIFPQLTFDISLTNNLPFSSGNKYADSNNSKRAFTSVTTGISYKTENLSVNDHLSLAFEKQNITDVLLVDSTILQGSSLYPFENNKSVNFSFDFTAKNDLNNSSEEKIIKLPKGNLLSSSSYFELTVKPSKNIQSVDYDLYLVLGINADNPEKSDTSTLPVWNLSDFTQKNVIQALDLSSNTVQTVKIALTNSQRAILSENNDIKLILKCKNNIIQGTDSGIIEIISYRPIIQNYEIEASQKIITSTDIITDTTSPFHKKYGSSSTYFTKLQWNFSGTAEKDERTIKAVKHIFGIKPASYKNINFDFAISTPADFSFFLKDNLTENISLAITIPSATVNNLGLYGESFHTLSFDTHEKILKIDNLKLDSSAYSYTFDASVIPNTIELLINQENITSLSTKEYFYCGNLYYTENDAYLNVTNEFDSSFNFKDGNVSLSSTQGLSSDSGFNSKINNFVNSSAAISYKPEFISLTGNATSKLSNNKAFKSSDIISSAGHSIKTEQNLFKVFSFNEIYRYNRENQNLDKSDTFGLNLSAIHLPLEINGKSQAKISSTSKTQNEYGEIIFTLIDKNKNQFKFTDKIELNQKQTSTEKNIFTSNYFTDWYLISQLQFNTGLQDSLRNVNISSYFGSQLFENKLLPSLSYELKGKNNLQKTDEYTDSVSYGLSVPFSIKNNNITFELNQKSEKATTHNGKNYSDDINYIFTTQNDNLWFYQAVPFYSYFSKALVQNIPVTNNSTFFTTNYKIEWKRKLFNDIKDLYIPISASASTSRDIRKTSISTSDYYQAKININNSFINLFGSDSNLKLINWYKQDEFAGNYDFTIKIPSSKNNSTVWNVNLAETLNLYLPQTNVFNLTDELFFSSDSSWKIQLKSSLNRKTPNNLLLIISKAILPSLENIDCNATVKDFAGISLNKNQTLRQNYEIGHTETISFLSDYFLSSGLNLKFIHETNKVFSLGIEYNLSIKISF